MWTPKNKKSAHLLDITKELMMGFKCHLLQCKIQITMWTPKNIKTAQLLDITKRTNDLGFKCHLLERKIQIKDVDSMCMFPGHQIRLIQQRMKETMLEILPEIRSFN